MFEDEQYEYQATGRPFLHSDKLNTLRKVHQAEVQMNDKLANDSSATLREMARCQALVKSPQPNDGIQLVAAGNLEDVQIAINDGRLNDLPRA